MVGADSQVAYAIRKLTFGSSQATDHEHDLLASKSLQSEPDFMKDVEQSRLPDITMDRTAAVLEHEIKVAIEDGADG